MTRTNRHKKKKRNLKFIPILLIFLFLFIVLAIVYFKLKPHNTNPSEPVSSSINNTVTDNNNSINAVNSASNTTVNNTKNSANTTNTANKVSNNINSAATNASSNTAANTSTNVTQDNTTVNDSNGNAISVTKAKTILESKINKTDQKLTINYDHLQTRDSTKYYVFRASESGSDSQSSNTSGWYYVNANSGEAYNWDLIDDKLDLLK